MFLKTMSNRLDQLLQFLERSPNEPFLLFAIAKEYENSQQLSQALTYYTELIEKHADYVGTYYHLGKLHEQEQRFAEAFHTYKQGMQIARQQGDQHALSELAGAKLNLGDDEDFED